MGGPRRNFQVFDALDFLADPVPMVALIDARLMAELTRVLVHRGVGGKHEVRRVRSPLSVRLVTVSTEQNGIPDTVAPQESVTGE